MVGRGDEFVSFLLWELGECLPKTKQMSTNVTTGHVIRELYCLFFLLLFSPFQFVGESLTIN